MHLITPIYFLLSIFLVGVLIFYLFRKQYDNQLIPSTLLWQQVMREWQATRWWKKLQQHILLYLQLLILLFLMLALVRPYIGLSELSGDHIVVVLDTSASMTAKEEDSSRFDMAKDDILELIDKLDNQMLTVILAENTPRILFSNETVEQTMERKVEEIEASYQHADIAKAVQIANQLLAGSTGEIHVYSDQVGQDDMDVTYLNHSLTVHNIGSSTNNLSIHTFGVAENDGKINGLLTIFNEDKKEQLVRIRLESDGEEISTLQEIIPPGKITQLVLKDLPSKPYYKAVITTIDDYEADNTAIAFLKKNTKPTIYLIGDINPFITKALSYVSTNIIQMEEFQDDMETNGIFILEDTPADQWPNGPSLIVSPSEGGPFEVQEKQLLTSGLQIEKEDPILQYIDVDEIYIQSSFPYHASELTTVVSSGDTPIISTGFHNGYPVVFLGFDVADSDWPLHTSFPIFLYNVMNFLSAGQENLGYVSPSETTKLAHQSGMTSSFIVSEGNEQIKELNLDNDFFQAPSKPGLYLIKAESDQGVTEKLFAVSVDPEEKYMQPVDGFTLNVDQNSTVKTEERPNEIWPWLAFIALLILILEWEVYRRGISN